MKSSVSCISYGGNEREIVKEGMAAIQKVLMGDNVGEKRSQLLALDWFMDPYYKQDIHIANIRSDLVKLLQTVVIWSNEDFEILEKNLDRVSERLKPYVLEVINMDKEK